MNTVLQTIIAGVGVLVVGQLVLKFILEPILDLKKLLGEISNCCLKNQGEIISAVKDEVLVNELFRLAAELLAKRQAISGYTFISWVFHLPSKGKVLEGAHNLNLMGNILAKETNANQSDAQAQLYQTVKKLGNTLGIVTSYESNAA